MFQGVSTAGTSLTFWSLEGGEANRCSCDAFQASYAEVHLRMSGIFDFLERKAVIVYRGRCANPSTDEPRDLGATAGSQPEDLAGRYPPDDIRALSGALYHGAWGRAGINMSWEWGSSFSWRQPRAASAGNPVVSA